MATLEQAFLKPFNRLKDIRHACFSYPYTTNKRFWEFNQDFRERLMVTRPQAIEMECATLFMAGYSHKVPVGALLLISDLPLKRGGIKTKKSSSSVYIKHTAENVEKGIKVLRELDDALGKHPKGVFRGDRRRFEQKIDTP